MSTAESWDLLVPEDDAELLAELHRRGVRPGSHLHVLEAPSDEAWEGVRRAVEAINAAVSSGLSDKLRAVVAQVDVPASIVPPELNEAQRAALLKLLTALNEAQATTRSAAEADPKQGRRLSFTGMITDGPTDMSAHTDDYLAKGFGRD